MKEKRSPGLLAPIPGTLTAFSVEGIGSYAAVVSKPEWASWYPRELKINKRPCALFQTFWSRIWRLGPGYLSLFLNCWWDYNNDQPDQLGTLATPLVLLLQPVTTTLLFICGHHTWCRGFPKKAYSDFFNLGVLGFFRFQRKQRHSAGKGEESTAGRL